MSVQFVFLVLPDIHLMDLAGPDQTIHEAADFGASFTIQYCGTGEKVVSSAGLPIDRLVHYSKIKLNEGDFLIIPGSKVDYILSDEFTGNVKLHHWINDLHSRGVRIVSICAGAFVLGFCGLLDGRACTTHFKRTTQLQQLYPKAIVQENVLFVEEDGIYTSAGIASGIDLMLFIIEKLRDSYFAHKVARELVIYNRRDGHNEQHSVFMQFRNHIHSGIHKAQDFIVENIHRKHPLHELADLACMSERNFTRVFKKETGITVNDYITLVRKEVILKLQMNRDLSLKQIAAKVGLDSEKQVKRILTAND